MHSALQMIFHIDTAGYCQYEASVPICIRLYPSPSWVLNLLRWDTENPINIWSDINLIIKTNQITLFLSTKTCFIFSRNKRTAERWEWRLTRSIVHGLRSGVKKATHPQPGFAHLALPLLITAFQFPKINLICCVENEIKN